MDEKYFEDMLWRIGDDPDKSCISILKQIAHDARVDQARVDREAVEECLGASRLNGDNAQFRNGIIKASSILTAVAPEEGA